MSFILTHCIYFLNKTILFLTVPWSIRLYTLLTIQNVNTASSKCHSIPTYSLIFLDISLVIPRIHRNLQISEKLPGLDERRSYYYSNIEYYDWHMRNDCLQLELGRCSRRAAVTELSKREESHCTRRIRRR